MMKIKATLLFFLSLTFIDSASASSLRTIDGDAVTSANHTKTWTGPGASGTIMVSSGMVQEIPTGTVNGSNTSFTISNTPGVSATVILALDGRVLIQGGGQDYTISGATITMATAPATGQGLYASYSKY